MKQKKLIFNFFVNRNWKKLTDSRKRAQILADNRKSHHPIETLLLANRDGSLQWMLLSNIAWMAPGGMAFKKNYINKQIKLKWIAAPSNDFFKILAGIMENYPYGNDLVMSVSVE